MSQALDDLITKERHRRERRKQQKRPMYWWQETNQFPPPENDVWCEYCFAYYGVTHDGLHEYGSYCRFMGRALRNDRQCACVDCVCAEMMGGEGSLASRITQA